MLLATELANGSYNAVIKSRGAFSAPRVARVLLLYHALRLVDARWLRWIAMICVCK